MKQVYNDVVQKLTSSPSDVELQFIFKEGDKHNPYNLRDTAGWKFIYERRAFGDYITLGDKLTKEMKKDIMDVLTAQAQEALDNVAILKISNDWILRELIERYQWHLGYFTADRKSYEKVPWILQAKCWMYSTLLTLLLKNTKGFEYLGKYSLDRMTKVH